MVSWLPPHAKMLPEEREVLVDVISRIELPACLASNRLPELSQFFSSWRARHTKMFMMDVAPVAMWQRISSSLYFNFLAYSFAIRVMLSPDMPSTPEERTEYADLAYILIRLFQKELGVLYGRDEEKHNAHLGLFFYLLLLVG